MTALRFEYSTGVATMSRLAHSWVQYCWHTQCTVGALLCTAM